MIDGWETGDQFGFSFDGTYVTRIWSKRNTHVSGLIDICGLHSQNDFGQIRIQGSFIHSSSTLEFKVICKTSGLVDDETFGFRNLQIFFAVNPHPSSNFICGRNAVDIADWKCPCSDGQYQGSGSSCISCHPNCLKCFGLSEKECYQCKDGIPFNGIACAICEPHCEQCTTTECFKCEAGAILDKGVCKVCDAMHIKALKGSMIGYQYRLQLLPNSCDLDLDTVKQLLVISTESLSEFPAFTLKTTKVSSNTYRLDTTNEDTVVETTILPISLAYLNGALEVPRKIVPNPTLQAIAEYAPAGQTGFAVAAGASLVGTLAMGATAVLWSLISFQQFIGYFYYINVDYPFQVQFFLSMSQFMDMNAFPNPIASLTEGLSRDILNIDDSLVEEYQPPQKFLNDDITSFFIQNAGSIFALNILLLMILAVILCLQKIQRLKKNRILNYIKQSLMWNTILRTFLENGAPLALATFLQLRVFSFDHAYFVICSILSIISFMYYVVITLFSVALISKQTKIELDDQGAKQIYGTLYEGMVLEKPLSRYYYLLILLRGVLIVFLIAFFDDMPYMQILPLIYYNAGLLYYLFNSIAFDNSKLDKINKMKEAIVLISEVLILFLHFDIAIEAYYEVIGWMIVGLLGFSLVVEFCFTLGLQIVGAYIGLKTFVRWIRSKHKKKDRLQKLKPKFKRG